MLEAHYLRVSHSYPDKEKEECLAELIEEQRRLWRLPATEKTTLQLHRLRGK